MGSIMASLYICVIRLSYLLLYHKVPSFLQLTPLLPSSEPHPLLSHHIFFTKLFFLFSLSILIGLWVPHMD